MTALLRWLGFVWAMGLLGESTFGDFVALSIPDRRDYAFDNNGILYVSTSGGVIRRYDTRSGSFLSSFTVGGSLLGIDLSPDGSTLAVADETPQGDKNRFVLVNTTTGAPTAITFARDSLEIGTFMVAWGSDGQLLFDTNLAGSGWVPLRRYDPVTNSITTGNMIRQSSLLAPSADRRTIAIAETGYSLGPISAYDVASHSYQGSVWTFAYLSEVAINRDGSKIVLPSNYGTFVLPRSGANFTEQPFPTSTVPTA